MNKEDAAALSLLVAGYFDDLISAGFQRSEAILLVVEYQTHLLKPNKTGTMSRPVKGFRPK